MVNSRDQLTLKNRENFRCCLEIQIRKVVSISRALKWLNLWFFRDQGTINESLKLDNQKKLTSQECWTSFLLQYLQISILTSKVFIQNHKLSLIEAAVVSHHHNSINFPHSLKFNPHHKFLRHTFPLVLINFQTAKPNVLSSNWKITKHIKIKVVKMSQLFQLNIYSTREKQRIQKFSDK